MRPFSPGYLPDRAVETPRVHEIDAVDRRNSPARNTLRIDLAAEPDGHQDRDLRARIVSIDVGRRIRLGIAQGLGLFQRIGKRQPLGVHARQDVIAGAVEDAGDAKQPISRQPFAHRADDGNAARDRRLEQQLALHLPRERQQLDAVRRDELLVGGDHRLAGLQRSPNQLSRRLETAHQLDDDMSVRVDHRVEAVGPLHVRRNPVDLLPLDAAVADEGELQRRMNVAQENSGNRSAYRAEADERHFERLHPRLRAIALRGRLGEADCDATSISALIANP